MSKVKITTHYGDMICELYDNETPITVKNFLQLIAKKFYDGLNFHRVIPGFCHNRQGTQHLDGNHTCFGRVIEGEKIIDVIKPGDVILSISVIPDVQETIEPSLD